MKRLSLFVSCVAALLAFGSADAKAPERDITVGILSNISGSDVDGSVKKIADAGFKSFQTHFNLSWTDQTAAQLKTAMDKYGTHVSALIYCTPNGRWNFLEGPSTIGLVPPINRLRYLDNYKKAIDFCVKAGIPALHSHLGFIPESPTDALYAGFIETMQELAGYAKERGICILCETGQETPVTLIRAINDIATGNVFVNCDVANLILYGKANPIDAVKQFGPLLHELHAKDGKYPTNPYFLGKEVKIPEGDVNFPVLIETLKAMNFKGVMTIEVELGGNNSDYIVATKKYLEGLIDKK